MRRLLALLCIFVAFIAVPGKAEDGDRVIATVLGKAVLLKNVTPASAAAKQNELSPEDYAKWLRSYRANLMLYAICGPVMRDYVVREKLKPTDEEISQTIKGIMTEHVHPLPTDEEEGRKLGMRLFWLHGTSREWRTAKALHEKYGGRVGISSFGACTAIDGLNAVLQDYETRGDLVFHDPDLEEAFWEKVRGAPFTDVVLRPERVPQHFETPPWERWRQELMREAKESSPPHDEEQ